jgi:dihydroorotate dehydrogenase
MTLSSSDIRAQPHAGKILERLPKIFRRTARFSANSFRMRWVLERMIQRVLLHFKPEFAHDVALKLLIASQPILRTPIDDERLGQRVFGLNFKNPVGVAAGLDKDAQAVFALLKVGFGFAEAGTVTPLPQPGNESPRVFRLANDQAIINRFGFNSDGADEVLRRLAGRVNRGGIVGVNVGANKDSHDRISDYVRLIERFAPVASYFAINISSPNTPGLRDLQKAPVLHDLLARVIDARERVAQHAGPTPVLLKIAPDLSLVELDDVVGIARKHRVDGMIIGNTTVTRPSILRDTDVAKEAGGLSGRPLFPLATRMLAETYVRVEGTFPLIGTGGIDSGSAAVAKFRAGASLVQLYSALIFRGLGLIDEIKAALLAALERDRLDRLPELVGADAAAVTAEPWPG